MKMISYLAKKFQKFFAAPTLRHCKKILGGDLMDSVTAENTM